jgi:hypothetical protein
LLTSPERAKQLISPFQGLLTWATLTQLCWAIEFRPVGASQNFSNSFSLRVKMNKYPDVSELLKKKQSRRHQLAKLPFEEKIKIVRQLQQLGKSIRQLRDNAASRTNQSV